MAENSIYYGSPGTGKTYFLQSLVDNYVDYDISDAKIKEIFTRQSDDWLLIVLVILQNKGKIKAAQIQNKIDELHLGVAIQASAVLEAHSVKPSNLGAKRVSPRIFLNHNELEWYVDTMRLASYDPDFFKSKLYGCKVEKRYAFVTFHQSFSYEDFIEGIRPSYDERTKAIDYSPKNGVFKNLCRTAHFNPEKQYAIFVDEINRGNVSEIFGELISLIELDKREGMPHELSVELPYSKEPFTVPQNVSVFGTMNSADKSIAQIDIALRRRFNFVAIQPDSSVIVNELELKGLNAKNIGGIDLIELFNTINNRIELLLDSDHKIGHSFFINVENVADIAAVIEKKVVPLLEEYFFDDLQKIQLVFNDLDSDGKQKTNAIYCHKDICVDDYFPFVADYYLEDKKSFELSKRITVDSLKKIYEK